MSTPNEKIEITGDSVKLITGSGVASTTTEIDPIKFYQNISQKASFDTGLLPLSGSGVLSIRHSLEYTQTAFQYEPGIYYVNWGVSERDPQARTYALAQPWRIVITDYKEGKLLGSKSFYSTLPIISGDEQLYHMNLPNLNCLGYGQGNTIGWLCLYHTEKTAPQTFREKLNRALERSSGVETYNDNNMSGTDGPRFYRKFYTAKSKDWNDFNYLWDPSVWEKKSKQEGWEWTLNDKLWIPVKAPALDEQVVHAEQGLPITFNRAIYGHYSAYYDDKDKKAAFKFDKSLLENGPALYQNNLFYKPVKKPFNLISRTDEELDKQQVFKAFKKSCMSKDNTSIWGNFNSVQIDKDSNDSFNDPIQLPQKCGNCHEEHSLTELIVTKIEKNPKLCKVCYDTLIDVCQICKKQTLKSQIETTDNYGTVCQPCYKTLAKCDMCKVSKLPSKTHDVFGTVLCYDCQPVYSCANCLAYHKTPVETTGFCNLCGKVGQCSGCNTIDNYFDLSQFQKGTHYTSTKLKEFSDKVLLCNSCENDYMICACGALKPTFDFEFVPSANIYKCSTCRQSIISSANPISPTIKSL